MKALLVDVLLRLLERLLRPEPVPVLPPNHRGDVHRRAREKRKELDGADPNRS